MSSKSTFWPTADGHGGRETDDDGVDPAMRHRDIHSHPMAPLKGPDEPWRNPPVWPYYGRFDHPGWK